MRAIIPAGKYYVGDPCYAFSHDHEGNEAWDAILNSSGFFAEQIQGQWNEHTVWASRTMWGDGSYRAIDTNLTFGVDAGLIGVIPEALVNHFENRNSAYALHLVEFHFPFAIESCDHDNNGLISIGTLNIYTGDEDL